MITHYDIKMEMQKLKEVLSVEGVNIPSLLQVIKPGTYVFLWVLLWPTFLRLVLMNPLMILVKIIKLRWIHILSYDQMVSRKINNQTTRCANSIFYTTLFTNSAPNYT